MALKQRFELNNEVFHDKYDSSSYRAPKQSDDKSPKHSLLIFGFIRDFEQNYNVFMSISLDIYQMILAFSPALPVFGIFDNNCFEVSEKGLVVRGTGKTCKARLIYIESWIKEGYKKGTHYLSVKNHNTEESCLHSIGVTNNIPNKIGIYNEISDDFPSDDNVVSYMKNTDINWNASSVATVKLDIDRGIIQYYCNGKFVHGEFIKDQGTVANISYQFAICICASKESIYEIVETPVGKPYRHSHRDYTLGCWRLCLAIR